MATIKSLDVALNAKSGKFDAAMRRAQKRVGSFSKAAATGFGHVARIGIGMGAAIGTAFSRSLRGMTEFETAMSRFAARTGGDVGALAKEYGAAADRIAIETGVMGTAIVDGFQRAVSIGAVGQDAIDLLGQAAKAEAAGIASVGEAVEAATKATAAFGQPYVHSLNAVVRSSQLGVGTSEDFARAMKQVAPQAKLLGADLTATAAAIAAISQQSAGIAEGTTQMKAFLTAIIKPSGEAEKALAKLGEAIGRPGYDSAALRERIAAGGLFDVIRELRSLDIGDLGKLGGSEAIAFVASPTVNFENLTELRRQIAESLESATEDAFKQGQNDLDRYLGQLAATWDVATRQVNSGLADTFRELVPDDQLLPTLRSVAETMADVGTALAKVAVAAYEWRHAVAWVVGSAAAFVVLGAAVHVATLVGIQLYGALTLLGKGAAWLFGTALPALGKALLAVVSPAGLAVVGIGALAYLASAVIRAWEPVSAFFAALWEGVKTGAEVLGLFVRNAFLDLRDALYRFLNNIAGRVNTMLAGIDAGLAFLGKDPLGWRLPTVDERVLSFEAGIRDQELAAAQAAFGNAAAEAASAFGDAVDGVVDVFEGDAERVKQAWRKLLDGAAALPGDLLDLAYSGLPGPDPASPADETYYAGLGLPERTHHLPAAPTPATSAQPAPTPVTVADMEPPARTAAASLSDALRSAFRSNDLSDVGRAAWDSFRGALVDTFFDRFEDALGNLFDGDPKSGFFGGLLNFDSGGEVPGPAGRPRLAVVHGGEVVMTPNQRRGQGVTVNQTVNYVGDFDQAVLDALERRAFQAGAILGRRQ